MKMSLKLMVYLDICRYSYIARRKLPSVVGIPRPFLADGPRPTSSVRILLVLWSPHYHHPKQMGRYIYCYEFKRKHIKTKRIDGYSY